MKKLLFTLLLIASSCSLFSQVIFTSLFGTAQNGEAAVDMIRTADNNYVLLGNKTGGEIFLVKADTTGGLIWSKNFLDFGYTYAPSSITELPNGDLIIVGSKRLNSIIFDDIFVMRTNASGNIIWENALFSNSNRYEKARSVKTTADGNFIIVGSSQNGTGFSHNPITAKMDTSGTIIWSNTQDEFEPYDITEFSDGTFISCGYYCSICTANSHDAMLAKFNATGSLLWVNTYTLTGYNDAWNNINKTLSGDIVVGGTVDSAFLGTSQKRNSNIHVAKLDTSGTLLWQNNIRYPYRDALGSIVETNDSLFHVTGAVQHIFPDIATQQNETVHLQLSQNGNLLCANFFNPTFSAGNAMLLTPDNNLMIAGYWQTDTSIAADMLMQKIVPNCCTSPSSLVIQAPDTFICTGDTFNLSVTIPSGTTVSWYNANFSGQPSLSNADTLQLPTGLGTGGIFYVVSQNQCGVSYSDMVQIRGGNISFPPTLSVTSGSSAICSGDSVTLFSQFQQTGITTPQWVFNGTIIGPSSGFAFYQAKNDGDYWVTAFTSCDTINSDTIHVSVSNSAPPTPILFTTDTTLCGGTNTVTLTTMPCADCIYHWYDETGNYTETLIPELTVSDAHIYSVVVINPCDSSISADSIIIQLGSALPVPVITQSNDTLFSSYATGNQWLLNNNIIPGATGSSYTPLQSGSYSVIATQNNCSSQSSSVSIIITEMNELNAFSDYIITQQNNYLNIKSGISTINTIQIFSSDGRLLSNLSGLDSKDHRLDISNIMQNGVYLLRVISVDKTVCRKIYIK